LKELGKTLAYLAGTVLLGALLAPPLFWLGQAVAARGVLTFLAETDFQKFFNRAVLVAAVVLLWPVARWLRIGGWRELGLEPDPRWWRRVVAGFVIAGSVVAAMAAVYVALDIYNWKKELRWDVLPRLLLSACVVALLEEALFRGAMLGLFRRSMRPLAALLAVTFIFAAVHFLKPDDSVVIAHVRWHSGFALLPHVFHQFAEPMTLLAGFTTIFALGWIVGAATLWTRSLWLGIGFHAGLVFVKMSFSKFTKRQSEHLPWVGEELQIGLVPVAALAMGGLLVWWWLRREKPPVD
jgi:membrane protease YdiL (CAAX protease family)